MTTTKQNIMSVILCVLVGCNVSSRTERLAESDPGDPTPPVLMISARDLAVFEFTFSPNGTLLASAERNGNAAIRILNSETGEQRIRFQAHVRAISGLAFSPDGALLISASEDGTIKFWDPESGALARTIETGFPVTCLALSRSGDRIACGGNRKWTNGTVDPETGVPGRGSSSSPIRIWDAETAELITDITVQDGGGAVVTLAFGHDGQQLASGLLLGHTIPVWKVPEGTLLRELKGHQRTVTSVVYSPDGRQLASGSSDQRVKIWSTETGEEITTLGHKDVIGCVNEIAYSPDGTQLATASGFGVHVWDLATEKRVRTLKDLTRGSKQRFLTPLLVPDTFTGSFTASKVAY